MEGSIIHSKVGGYYTLTINGKFVGNYDTFKEASDEFENKILEEAEQKEKEEVPA